MSKRDEYSEDVILPPDGYRLWWVEAHTRHGEEINYEVLVSTEGEADIIEWPSWRCMKARERIKAHEAANAVKKRQRKRCTAR